MTHRGAASLKPPVESLYPRTTTGLCSSANLSLVQIKMTPRIPPSKLPRASAAPLDAAQSGAAGVLACLFPTRVASVALLAAGSLLAAEGDGAARFHQRIQPVLTEFCSDCHADGARKGGVALDEFPSDQALLEKRELWLAALKNLRAGLMPPPRKPQPTAEQKRHIEQWIKSAVFLANPQDPDPGRVTVRRLNRVEYRNTVRDLLGVEFDTQAEFPADDTGHGFDNIGDALTLSPLLLEKYIAAAQVIVGQAVPSVGSVPAEKGIVGREFRRSELTATGSTNNVGPSGAALSLSYYEPASATNRIQMDHDGSYQFVLDLAASERFVDNQFDYHRCRVTFRLDGETLFQKEFTREGNRPFKYEFERHLKAGEHELVFEVEPLTPDEKRVRSLAMRLESVTLRGPLEKQHWVRPKNHARFFPREAPGGLDERRAYAREILVPFARTAYRRPVDDTTADRLVALAEATYAQPGKAFEAGISQAMVAVLASPRFLFREEGSEPAAPGGSYPLVDEFTLASRLSYFLWSTLPDAELFRLAGEKQLRTHLEAQVQRMMADARFDGFIRNFVGQWLQARDIETVIIDARQVLARDVAPDPVFEKQRRRYRALRDLPDDRITPEEKKEREELGPMVSRRFSQPLRAELNGDLRRAMRQETEKTFRYVVREDRSLRELLDGDYTFLNERLAKHYGLTDLNVIGDELRRVDLPADSPRGGILTQGTVLAVTSNPTRTSPVKRGVFILDNILGTPPPPPPPDITPLEDAAKAIQGRSVPLREMLALHREKPLCSGCHDRMDPLGLALENFNAMGMWRTSERGDVIDASSALLTGERFTDVRELKRILAGAHLPAFHRTLVEKMLTYALGRGLEYYDVETVDQIVERLGKAGGKPSALFAGIIGSAPFQKTRGTQPGTPSTPHEPSRTEARKTP